MRMPVCSSCRQAIIWAQTPRGKNIPLDAELVDGGNIELRAGIAFVEPPEPGTRRYRSHFASCPRAGSFRKPRPRPEPPPPEAGEMVQRLKERSLQKEKGRS
jgi:hypothetical protein